MHRNEHFLSVVKTFDPVVSGSNPGSVWELPELFVLAGWRDHRSHNEDVKEKDQPNEEPDEEDDNHNKFLVMAQPGSGSTQSRSPLHLLPLDTGIRAVILTRLKIH